MKAYRDRMDQLHFTKEQKTQLVDRLMEAAEQPVSRRNRGRLRRMVTVGVAAALVLAVGAGATVVLTPAGEVFSSILGGAPAQTEIIDRIGRPIGASDTQNGVTITADAIVGDTYSYAIVYSITREDGQPLADDLTANEFGYLPLLFQDSGTDVGHMGGMHGSSYFYDADPSDNSIQFVEMMTADSPIQTGTARASFTNLQLTDESYANSTILAEGTWNLKFDFAFEDAMVHLDAGQPLLFNGTEAVLDDVQLSPLSFQISYTVQTPNAANYNEYLNTLPVTLQLKDGSTVDLTLSGGGVHDNGNTVVCQKSDIFSQILPLDEIASITVGDVTLPVD